jgi:hypothetical protein
MSFAAHAESGGSVLNSELDIDASGQFFERR